MIRIIADTTCGLPVSFLEQMGIDVLPQIITFGGISYRDDHEIDTPTFLLKLKASANLPGTAAPPPILYRPIYEKHANSGDSMLVITPSSEISGTFRSASVAAEEFPGADIHIIDSRTIAGGLGMLVLQANKWAHEGMQMETLKANLLSMASREKLYFIVDTLEYLQKGGRIGKAESLIGGILQIKPILFISDGKVAPYDKQRTKKNALDSIFHLVVKICQNEHDPHLTISHCGDEKTAQIMRQRFLEVLDVPEIPIYLVPPAIVVHGGPGILEVSCFTS
jgi:DegV family protein with EDD domain